MRASDVVFAFPAVLSAIMIGALVGSGPLAAVLAIAIFNMPVFARVSRGVALQVWTFDYIAAARVPRQASLAHHGGGRAAEHRRRPHRPGDDPARARHPDRGRPELSRPRRAPAQSELGADAERCADLSVAGASPRDRAGRRNRALRCSASTSSATACATRSTRPFAASGSLTLKAAARDAAGRAGPPRRIPGAARRDHRSAGRRSAGRSASRSRV